MNWDMATMLNVDLPSPSVTKALPIFSCLTLFLGMLFLPEGPLASLYTKTHLGLSHNSLHIPGPRSDHSLDWEYYKTINNYSISAFRDSRSIKLLTHAEMTRSHQTVVNSREKRTNCCCFQIVSLFIFHLEDHKF